ncbi:hypothetical protein OSB04_029674 [Centaurea solstitialis]|uniref:DDE Tnp4 domain-containing protein n=1 Tax=Centaurea solstitialis TaxID=347529 RepID=A0AA38SJ50_9ASTR|nr:hypothetical protein OSB04_029674 [Centaurea solstitialis]
MRPTRLSFDVPKISAVMVGGDVVIYATSVLANGRTRFNQALNGSLYSKVWQLSLGIHRMCKLEPTHLRLLKQQNLGLQPDATPLGGGSSGVPESHVNGCVGGVVVPVEIVRELKKETLDGPPLEERAPYSLIACVVTSIEVQRITGGNDIICVNELRMDRGMHLLCCLDFIGREKQLSRYVHRVLCALLRLQDDLFIKPTLIKDDCTDKRWKPFKLKPFGAIDETYIEVTVPESDKPRYRTRKGNIAINVLGVCTRDMKFVYVLSGWEGSAFDSRVLRDAITRNNGFKISLGNYYESGNTTNNLGISYKAFGILKKRRAILRSPSFYPIKLQGRMVLAYALLHNFIRMYMNLDPEKNTILTLEDMPIGETFGIK